MQSTWISAVDAGTEIFCSGEIAMAAKTPFVFVICCPFMAVEFVWVYWYDKKDKITGLFNNHTNYKFALY